MTYGQLILGIYIIEEENGSAGNETPATDASVLVASEEHSTEYHSVQWQVSIIHNINHLVKYLL